MHLYCMGIEYEQHMGFALRGSEKVTTYVVMYNVSV